MIIGINYKDDLSKAKNYLDENGSHIEFSIFDYEQLCIEAGCDRCPRAFLVIDGKIVKHRIGEINQKVWNDEFKVFF